MAEGVDLLIHDAQYTADERESRIGWGHSSRDEAVLFANDEQRPLGVLSAMDFVTLFAEGQSRR